MPIQTALLRVLFVADSDDDVSRMVKTLQGDDFRVEHTEVNTKETLRSALRRRTTDVVLSAYSTSHLSGLDAFRVVAEESPDIPVIIVSEALDEGLVVETLKAGVYDYVLKSNLSRLGHCIRNALRDRERTVAHEHAEDALRHSERRYRRFVEKNQAGVLRYALDGRILECNEALVQFLGYASMLELKSRQVSDLHWSPVEFADMLKRLNIYKQLTNHQIRLKRKDGSPVPALVNKALVIDDVEGEVVEGTLIDLTNVKRLEAQILQAQKMESIGLLAGGIAHDFNNLLNLIQGYSGFLLERFGPEEESYADVREIQNATKQATGLTRQLLTFSRQQIVERVVLNLNDAVAGAKTMLRRMIREDIHLETRLSSELSTIHADPVMIQQLLMNLSVNGADAMPKGGKLLVETDLVDWGSFTPPPSMVPAKRYVKLTVTDTGTGMTPEVLSHLFEPFFTTKDLGKGTGLGLATVYGIVRQFSGHIEVSSILNEGTSVRMYFPAVEEAPAVRGSPVIPPLSKRGNATILVVEDDEKNRKMTRRILEGEGFSVFEAGNGEEGLAWCAGRSVQPDIVITDVIMPKMGGPELKKRLQDRWPGMKVLLMSGYTDYTTLELASFNIGKAFIQKPFSAEALCQKIRETLEETPIS